jgi:hypothetical protein
MTFVLISSSTMSSVFAMPKVVKKGDISCTRNGKDPVINPTKWIPCFQDFTYSDGVEATYWSAYENTNPTDGSIYALTLNMHPERITKTN